MKNPRTKFDTIHEINGRRFRLPALVKEIIIVVLAVAGFIVVGQVIGWIDARAYYAVMAIIAIVACVFILTRRVSSKQRTVDSSGRFYNAGRPDWR